MEERRHEPVLLAEALEALAVRPGGHYVDCTLGRGGHALAILERGGEVLALDADPEAIESFGVPSPSLSHRGGRGIRLVQTYFDRLEEVAAGFAPVDGVLFDLGLSSPQLEDPARGFSFAKDGPLDMRFDPGQGQPAASIVNHSSVDELARIFREYGEEPRARLMARAVEAARPLESTGQLARAIERAAGGRGRIHPATRIFQALRIATNRELERLSAALAQAVRILRAGGRLVAISFHSLEDRIVKTFIAGEARDCVCPPGTPVCVCGHTASLRPLARKPITPGPAEIARNPRARSAKMRAAERI
uniref:Ribosomal RNA small subunit methyltransferase H n=1 Tax=uncultured bacterium 5E7 TaxID=1701324 RepID=A0A0N9HU43_9BACT|nr:S-adenosyl-methyltransferase MraW [uncultured bacterium 5E7]